MGGEGALEKESIAAALRSEYLMDVRKMFYQPASKRPKCM